MRWGVEDVTVLFGERTALAGVDLAITPGTVTAVVGGDGAGKSTLLRVCSGALRPTQGTVRLPPSERIGAMAEIPGVYRDLTVGEHLRFVADAYGLSAATVQSRSRELLGRAGLADTADRLAGHLSGGMRQKLAVVLALLHRPDLLVLDELTTGVDPVSRAELWRLIGHAASGGAGVLVATTYLDEAERASEVLVLHAGRPLLHGAPDELIADATGLEDVVIARQLGTPQETVA
ncbi:MAG TPA: ABC transporter ATP-binding protein [Nitriliruptorales bacterium]|nr:ABC transporter ATP-binding protein [Nitriliruptorales bacterium]